MKLKTTELLKEIHDLKRLVEKLTEQVEALQGKQPPVILPVSVPNPVPIYPDYYRPAWPVVTC